MNKTFKVTIVSDDNRVIEVNEGETLLSGLHNAQFPVKSSCGGVARCADCVVKVVKGEEHLDEIQFKEKTLLGNVFFITKERLSCQTHLRGDISIELEKAGTSEQKKTKTIIKKPNQIRPQTGEKREGNNGRPPKKGGFNRPKKLF
ncbi:MAG: 2Fe-2S iron-sulfur cluster-binding protein [Bacteriovoracaceae bacterium]